jgi:flagellar biosynthesis protein FlhA
VHQLLDNLRQHSPKLVEELVPEVVRPAQIHQVLCNLLRERVPIRNLETVLQTLGDYAERTQDPGVLTEYVRQALSRTICQQYRDRDRVLRVVTLDPAVEDLIDAGVSLGERGLTIKLAPRVTEAINRGIAEHLVALTQAGFPPVLLTSPGLRAALRHITAAALPALAVLSLNEITRDTQVELAGQMPLEALRDRERHLAAPAAAWS